MERISTIRALLLGRSMMELSQDTVDNTQKKAREFCEEVKRYVGDNATTEAERVNLHDLFCKEIQKKLRRQGGGYRSVLTELLDKDPRTYYLELISKESIDAFRELLSIHVTEVNYINALYNSNELKYDSPPSEITEIVKCLLKRYPLEFEDVAMDLSKECVRTLCEIHDLEQKVELWEWFRSFKSITASTSISNGLKLLKEDENFHKFKDANLHYELEDYKIFLLGHDFTMEAKEEYDEHIQDIEAKIADLRKQKPYDYETGMGKLAVRIVNEGCDLGDDEDAKVEILKLWDIDIDKMGLPEYC